MSFNKCPPEVITEIFSHLLDVRSKIRLERVSKTFRDCVRDEDSWKRNTTLEMGEFGSDHQLRSFLTHAKEINALSFTVQQEYEDLACPEMTATLFEFEAKLKIDHFYLSFTTDEKSAACPRYYDYLVASCLGKFHNSLTSMDLSCCWRNDCPLLQTFAALLPRCSNLKHLTLRQFSDHETHAGHYGAPDTRILPVLSELNLETLCLVDFHEGIDMPSLVAVFNSTREHPIRSLRVQNTRRDSMSFCIIEFVRGLNGPAAQALTSIEMLDVSSTFWIEVISTLPTKLPNLSRITIRANLRSEGGDYCRMAQRYATHMGEFLNDCLKRENTIHMRLVLFGTKEFRTWLWEAVNLIEVRRSGTKEEDPFDRSGWKRTVTNKNGTLDLEIRRSKGGWH